jgi:outer membrane receptor protein involved in Fe transport
MAFTTVNTGLALGDFMIGKANTFTQSRISGEWFRQNFFSLYVQDTWKATSHLTLYYGLRWEPYLAPYDANAKRAFFNRERFDRGLKSELFPNAPAGIYFQGEGGIPDTLSMFSNDYKHFAPRLGLAWDPERVDRTCPRQSYTALRQAQIRFAMPLPGHHPWNRRQRCRLHREAGAHPGGPARAL